MPVTKRYSTDWGSTGMAGVLTWQVRGPAGNFGTAVTTGITAGTVSGKRYWVDVSVTEEMEGSEVVFSDGLLEDAVPINAAQAIDPAFRRFSVDWDLPGYLGTLAYTITGPAGAAQARTTANVQVSATDSGRYYVDVFVTSLMLGAEIVWDDGVDETAESVEGGQTPTALVTAQTGGTPLPTTRLLSTAIRTGTPPALTDPTGNLVYFRNIRRQDTGIVVVPDITATRISTGVYQATVSENGYVLLYDEEFTINGVPWSVDRVSFPDRSHYANASDLNNELGTSNAALHADLDNNVVQVDIDRYTEASLAEADARVNRKLAAYSPPPAAYPVTSTMTWVTTDLRLAATKYAAGMLLNKRSKQVGTNNPPQTPTNGDLKIAEGDEILAGLIAAGLPGVTTEVDDTPGIDSLVTLSPGSAGLNDCLTTCTYDYRALSRAF